MLQHTAQNASAVPAFNVMLPVNPQLICDLVVSAFEGASVHWLRAATKKRSGPIKDRPWYADASIYNAQLVIGVEYEDPDVPDEQATTFRIVTMADINRGMQLMAEKSLQHFADAVAGDWDATTADVFFQYVVLGDVIYG